MPDPFEEPRCLDPGPPESLTETLADLSARVAALEARLARKRPDTNGRRMTRLDRCPFGWKPHAKNPARLIEDAHEQQTIQHIVEAAQNPAMGPRALCRHLDSVGIKRRGGKPWAGAHGLIRAILDREGIATACDAERLVRSRCSKPAVVEPPSGTSEAETGQSVHA